MTCAFAEFLDPDLPLVTAMRAAVERGQVLQSDGRVTLLAPKLLRGFTRIVGGGEVARPDPQEAA